MNEQRTGFRGQSSANALCRLIRAQLGVLAAEGELDDALKAAYPVNADVVWKWGDYLHAGRVVTHGYGDRLEVLNTATGKTRWIGAYNIIEGLEKPL